MKHVETSTCGIFQVSFPSAPPPRKKDHPTLLETNRPRIARACGDLLLEPALGFSLDSRQELLATSETRRPWRKQQVAGFLLENGTTPPAYDGHLGSSLQPSSFRVCVFFLLFFFYFIFRAGGKINSKCPWHRPPTKKTKTKTTIEYKKTSWRSFSPVTPPKRGTLEKGQTRMAAFR